MTKPVLFITGDRMMTPFYPMQTALVMMRAINEGYSLATGINDGVEHLVRAIADETEVSVQVIEQKPLDVPENPGHWIDWDARHASLGEDAELVSIHVDPQSCRVTSSAIAVAGDRVRLVTLLNLAE